MKRSLGLVFSFVSIVTPPLAADAPVARVADRAIDVSDFELRARAIAPGQWQAFGPSWHERRRGFLDEVMVADALLEIEAAKIEPSAKLARDAALSRALLAQLAADIKAAPPSRAQIEEYYERHRPEFETPAAIQIWRILVQGEKEARDIIDQLGTPNVADFSRIARDRSIDHATHMRAGSLGFVAADGQTEMPELRVATQLFDAASKVRDGDLVKAPVPENGRFAVVWRRGSRAAQRETLQDVTPLIQERLFEIALASSTRELLERLWRDGLRERHPEIVGSFEPPLDSSVTRASRSAAPLPARPVQLRPEPGDYGLR